MAQLNCPTCYTGMFMDQWGNVIQDQRSGSNVSLNMPQGFSPMPMWMGPMGTWHGGSPSMGMFPYPMMMPNQDCRSHSRTGSPSRHSRAGSPSRHSRTGSPRHSRAGSPRHSRAGSPPHKVPSPTPSRKSQRSRKPREDSDEEKRSVFSYADKSERKSVRDRAERIKAQRKDERKEEKKNIKDDKWESNSVRNNREERNPVRKSPMNSPIRSPPVERRIHTSSESEDYKKSPVRNGRNQISSESDDYKKSPVFNGRNQISSESEDYKYDNPREFTPLRNKDDSDDYKSSDKECEEFKIPEDTEPPTELPCIPDQEWECEHCTFVNEAGTRVCAICCKTPTVKVKIIPNTPKTKVSSGTNTQKTMPTEQPKKEEIKTQKNKKEEQTNTKKGVKEISTNFDKLNNEEPVLNNINHAYEGLNNKINNENKKGRGLRKITFWPGTKFTTFYK